MLICTLLLTVLCSVCAQLARVDVQGSLASPTAYWNAPQLDQDASPFISMSVSAKLAALHPGGLMFTTRAGFMAKRAYIFLVRTDGLADSDGFLRKYTPMGLILNMTVLPAMQYFVKFSLPNIVKPRTYQLIYGDDNSFQAMPLIVSAPDPLDELEIKDTLSNLKTLDALDITIFCLTNILITEKCEKSLRRDHLARLETIIQLASIEERYLQSLWMTFGFLRTQDPSLFLYDSLSAPTNGDARRSGEEEENDFFYIFSKNIRAEYNLSLWNHPGWIRLYMETLEERTDQLNDYQKKHLKTLDNWVGDLYAGKGLPEDNFKPAAPGRKQRSSSSARSLDRSNSVAHFPGSSSWMDISSEHFQHIAIL